jgi:hypothetical protein
MAPAYCPHLRKFSATDENTIGNGIAEVGQKYEKRAYGDESRPEVKFNV